MSLLGGYCLVLQSNAITHGAGATLGLSRQMLQEFEKIHLV